MEFYAERDSLHFAVLYRLYKHFMLDHQMKIKLPISKNKEILLVREAAMASMSIGIGLTHIRKYDFVQPGFFIAVCIR